MKKICKTENPAIFYYKHLRPGTRLTQAVRRILYNKQTEEDIQVMLQMLMCEFGLSDKKRIPVRPIIEDCGFAIEYGEFDQSIAAILCTGNKIGQMFSQECEKEKLIVINSKFAAELSESKTRTLIVRLFTSYLLASVERDVSSFTCAISDKNELCEIPEHFFILQNSHEAFLKHDSGNWQRDDEEDFTPCDYDSEEDMDETEEGNDMLKFGDDACLSDIELPDTTV